MPLHQFVGETSIADGQRVKVAGIVTDRKIKNTKKAIAWRL